MFQFTYKLKVAERVKARCDCHPRYNPERDGRGGIKGDARPVFLYTTYIMRGSCLTLLTEISEESYSMDSEPQTAKEPRIGYATRAAAWRNNRLARGVAINTLSLSSRPHEAGGRAFPSLLRNSMEGRQNHRAHNFPVCRPYCQDLSTELTGISNRETDCFDFFTRMSARISYAFGNGPYRILASVQFRLCPEIRSCCPLK
jgi:hypothetical protein